jgi:hypothetical protein
MDSCKAFKQMFVQIIQFAAGSKQGLSLEIRVGPKPSKSIVNVAQRIQQWLRAGIGWEIFKVGSRTKIFKQVAVLCILRWL